MKNIGVSCCALLSVVSMPVDAGALFYLSSLNGSSLIDTYQALYPEHTTCGSGYQFSSCEAGYVRTMTVDGACRNVN